MTPMKSTRKVDIILAGFFVLAIALTILQYYLVMSGPMAIVKSVDVHEIAPSNPSPRI